MLVEGVAAKGADGPVETDSTVETAGAGADGAVVDAAPRKYWRKESCWTAGLDDELPPTFASWSAKEVAAAEVLAMFAAGSSAGCVVKGLVAVIIGSLTLAKKNAIPGPFRLRV